MTLDAPNGGEHLCAGTTATIQWTVSIAHVTLNWDLEYSTTGSMGPWIPIATDLPAGDTSAGSVHTYAWTVPAAPTTLGRVRVKQDNSGVDCTDFSDLDFTIHGPASATFRADNAGVNATGYLAAPPVLGALWTASVDNGQTGNTLAGVAGYAGPLDLLLSFGFLLVDITDPNGELLQLPLQAGTGVVGFSLSIPDDPALCGIPFATRGYGLGGGAGIRLHNAYDLVLGG
ncbi:MAG: hypothetical protein AB1726_10055 [Planctomycetota bacterium]